MFEKEAEEYAIKSYGNDAFTQAHMPQMIEPVRMYLKQGFKEGAEFGYNKANEWHYVKNGDLPDEDVYVYLSFRGQEYPIVARRHLFKEWGRLKWCWDCKWGSGYTIEADNDKIFAWKEIVLPKESEKCK